MASMDYELALLSSIRHHGLDAFYDRLRVSEAFSEDFFKVINDFKEHVEKHGQMPSVEACKEFYGYSVDEMYANDPPSFYMELIEKSFFHGRTKEIVQLVIDQAKHDPKSSITNGFTQFRDLSSQLADADGVYLDACDYAGHETYLREMMLDKPIPSFCQTYDNRLSGGYRKGELIALAARPGEGKTWALLLNAIRAWKLRKRVVFVTTEMSAEEVRSRNLCLSLGLPISKVGSYILSMHRDIARNAEKKWIREGIHGNFNILKEDNQAVEDVESRVLSYKPDVVFIDGFYLLRTYQNEREKHVRVGNVINRLKRFARSSGICVVVATQLNRDSSGLKRKVVTRDLGNLSFSDEIGMICDHVVFLSRDKVEARANVMKFEIAKGRRISNQDDIHFDFDLENPRNSFEEIDAWDYESRVKIAKEEAIKNDSQHSAGDFSHTSAHKGYQRPSFEKRSSGLKALDFGGI